MKKIIGFSKKIIRFFKKIIRFFKKILQSRFLSIIDKLLFVFSSLFILTLTLSLLNNKINQYGCVSIINLLNTVDYKNLPQSLIAISFTLLGFGITCRNIIISKDTSKFNIFPISTLIDYGNNFTTQACWYFVVCIPFYSLIIYIVGFRRQIYFFVFFSGMCLIYYFFTVLSRIRKENCENVVAYIIINNLLVIDNKKNIEYRKEIFQKLIDTKNSFILSKTIFSRTLIFFSKIVQNKDKHIRPRKILSKAFFTRTLIQKEIKQKWNNKSHDNLNDYHKTIIKSFSIYSYDYFNSVLTSMDKSENQYLLIQFNEIINQFVSDNINQEKYQKQYLLNTLNNILQIPVNKKEYKKHKLKKKKMEYYDKLYMLFINIVFGLIVSCVTNLELNEFDSIIKLLSETINDNNIYISDDVLNTLSLYAFYYVFSNENITTKITIAEAKEHINYLLFHSSNLYNNYIETCLFGKFTILEYSDTLDNIFNKIHNDQAYLETTIFNFEGELK